MNEMEINNIESSKIENESLIDLNLSENFNIIKLNSIDNFKIINPNLEENEFIENNFIDEISIPDVQQINTLMEPNLIYTLLLEPKKIQFLSYLHIFVALSREAPNSINNLN